MDYPKNGLANSNSSEYTDIEKDTKKKLKLTEAVVGSFEKKLGILAEAIEELNLDIREREQISRQVREATDRDAFVLEFQLKELKRWSLGAADSVAARRLGLERELFDLRQQKRSEEIKQWSDISSLKRKRRDLIMEYQSLVKIREAIAK